MKNLQREYFKVQILSEKVGNDFLYNSNYKKERELWVLGAFYQLLRASDEYCDVWFEDREKPDFTLALNSVNKSFGVEITEIMHYGRRRGDEKDKLFDINSWMQDLKKRKIDPWVKFKEGLKKN